MQRSESGDSRLTWVSVCIARVIEVIGVISGVVDVKASDSVKLQTTNGNAHTPRPTLPRMTPRIVVERRDIQTKHTTNRNTYGVRPGGVRDAAQPTRSIACR